MTDFGQVKNSPLLDSSAILDRMLEALGMTTQKQIARFLGISESSVSQWNKRESFPSLEKLVFTSEVFKVSLHWLVTGQGDRWVDIQAQTEQRFLEEITEPLRSMVAKAAKQENKSFADEVRDLIEEGLKAKGFAALKVEQPLFYSYVGEVILIPLVGTVAAGRPIQPIQIQELVPVAIEWSSGNKKMWALRVDGHSMIDDGLEDGDLIICTDPETFSQGMMVIALVDRTDTTVKRVFRRNGKIVLVPSNPTLKELPLDPERVEIQGRVVTIQKKIR